MSVILYTLRNCPTCDKARDGLKEHGVEFEERQVDANEEWWEEALKYAFTVPVIVWGEDDVEMGWQGENG
jgi:glutaredoxin